MVAWITAAASGVLMNALAPATLDTPVADSAARQGYRPSRVSQPDERMMFLLANAARCVAATPVRVDGGTQAPAGAA